MIHFDIHPLDHDSQELAGAARLYAAAFHPPLADRFTPGQARDLITEPSEREGYAALVAVRAEQVIGLAFGWRSRPGLWWTETVARLLGDEAETWLGDSFELATMAVAESERGKGVGAALLTALIESRPERTATLAVHPDNAAARRLYESHGWHILRERIGPAQGTHARMLMAKQLRYERV
jgi:ribosomal protein S18 acetylase RimI-like enzyme